MVKTWWDCLAKYSLCHSPPIHDGTFWKSKKCHVTHHLLTMGWDMMRLPGKGRDAASLTPCVMNIMMMRLPGKRKQMNLTSCSWMWWHNETAWQKKKCSVTHCMLIVDETDETAWQKKSAHSPSVGHVMRHDETARQKKKYSVTHTLHVLRDDESAWKRKMQCHSPSVNHWWDMIWQKKEYSITYTLWSWHEK